MKAMQRSGFIVAALVAAGAAAVLAPRGVASTANNGTFRFLTQTLPTGNKGKPYLQRVVTANADGPVTFSVTGAEWADTGLTLDPSSGIITGLAGNSGTYNFDLHADDGVNSQITKSIVFGINAAGGFSLAKFQNTSLADGRVGVAYTDTLVLLDSADVTLTGVVFGAQDLPPGVTLNGVTGALTGTPGEAGTFYATLTGFKAPDTKVVTVLPILVLPPLVPAASQDFQFETGYLNNGQVDLSLATEIWDQWETSGQSGSVSFGASGLPPGVSVSTSGEISGTPTQAGTFEVNLSAQDANRTITTNLTMVVAPTTTSNRYWDFFGIPAAFVNVDYQRTPPIYVRIANYTSPTYSATGLPTGMTYNTGTGELAGTPTEVGEYEITFTCVDAGETLVLGLDFVVLPPSGGDTSKITTNLWVTKHMVRPDDPGSGSWSGSAIYNADRTGANVFDGTADLLSLQIGNHSVQTVPAETTGTAKRYDYATASGVEPSVRIRVSPARQTIQWKVSRDTIDESVPATLEHMTFVGGRGYKLEEAFSERGIFKPALGYRRRAFVLAKGSITQGAGPGKDSAKLSFLLADPNFTFVDGDVLKIRILNGATEVFSRDFTALGIATTSIDSKTGATLWKMKALKDPATTNRVAKFSFATKAGKTALNLSGLTLAGIPGTEAHLGLELTIDDNVYFTTVTFFEGRTGRYSLKMPL